MSPSALIADAAEETREVFEHHLGAFAHGLDAVLSDYAEDSIVITPEATYRGIAEIRGFFRPFVEGVSQAFWDAFKVHARSVEGEVAYIAWSSEPAVPMATDTLLVRGRKIAVHTFTPLKR
jgi:ketosteroid isomerase-like protein